MITCMAAYSTHYVKFTLWLSSRCARRVVDHQSIRNIASCRRLFYGARAVSTGRWTGGRSGVVEGDQPGGSDIDRPVRGALPTHLVAGHPPAAAGKRLSSANRSRCRGPYNVDDDATTTPVEAAFTPGQHVARACNMLLVAGNMLLVRATYKRCFNSAVPHRAADHNWAHSSQLKFPARSRRQQTPDT